MQQLKVNGKINLWQNKCKQQQKIEHVNLPATTLNTQNYILIKKIVQQFIPCFRFSVRCSKRIQEFRVRDLLFTASKHSFNNAIIKIRSFSIWLTVATYCCYMRNNTLIVARMSWDQCLNDKFRLWSQKLLRKDILKVSEK